MEGVGVARAELKKAPPNGLSVGLGEEEDIFKWEVMFIMPDGSL